MRSLGHSCSSQHLLYHTRQPRGVEKASSTFSKCASPILPPIWPKRSQRNRTRSPNMKRSHRRMQSPRRPKSRVSSIRVPKSSRKTRLLQSTQQSEYEKITQENAVTKTTKEQ